MRNSTTSSPFASSTDDAAIEPRFAAAVRALHVYNDRFFARFMIVQWLATIVLAVIVSPRTWEGRTSSIHIHIWAAIVLGGLITAYPAWLGLTSPGRTLTRHVIAASQMLMSALLIHLTAGRIETHFHVFGSLAFLAFYRDIRVLATATLVVYVDHLARGFFWPQSVYGVLNATAWRSIEHAFWVLFEISFLSISIRLGLREMRTVASRQIGLEELNREKAEEVRARTKELAESEERFRSFFRDAPIGMYRATPSGELEAANPAMVALLGFSSFGEMETAVAQKAAADARRGTTGWQDAGRAEFFAGVLKTDRVVSREATWTRVDGVVVHIRESARAFRDVAGQVTRIDGTVEDFTDRSQLEERYRHAQKVQAIGQLAGGVAHDFNNILTAIGGYSEMLVERASIDPKALKWAQEIHGASERAASLTHQLLAFSRKQHLRPRVLQLSTVVGEMDHMLRRLVGEHISIRVISTPQLNAVRADPGQLQQVLMNLVVNARDAMTTGGQLTIETANVSLDAEYARHQPDIPVGEYVMLAVSDTGTGMPPEVKSRLFEPFFTTKPVGTGTGLGLATCHGIVKQSGGHIVVYSEVGRGSTFKVYLPVAVGHGAAKQEPVARRDVQGGGETILVVEDEASVRDFTTDVLSNLGYKIITASNGVDALKCFVSRNDIDVIVTDVVMPDMGGAELAKRVRSVSPQVRILFTSGYTFDALGENDLLGPNAAFLSKPFGTAQLGLALRELIKNSPSVVPARTAGGA
jgi:PAS domain S-box-containing protein